MRKDTNRITGLELRPDVISVIDLIGELIQLSSVQLDLPPGVDSHSNAKRVR